MKRAKPSILCFCSDVVHCKNQTCEAKNGGACFHYAEIVHFGDSRIVEQEHTYGCLQDEDHGGGIFQCRANLLPHATPKDIKCCYDEDFCNLKLNTTVTASPVETDSLTSGYFWSHNAANTIIFVMSTFVSLFIFIVLGSCVVYYFNKRKRKRGADPVPTADPHQVQIGSLPKPPRRLPFLHHISKLHGPRINAKARVRHTVPGSGSASNALCLISGDPSSKSSVTAPAPMRLKSTTCSDHVENYNSSPAPEGASSPFSDGAPYEIPDMTTGSGNGQHQPSLVVRTLGRELRRVAKVGAGSYGEVWKAWYRGDLVAMKIFHPIREEAFERERDIYQTDLLRHENILGYIGADIQSCDDCIRMVLVTDYCQAGSLYDFLKSHTIEFENALILIRTAAAGLDYLHNSVIGTTNKSKPAIAHRDIKSKNILVKQNFVCVIADLGLAMIKKKEEDEPYQNAHRREGTVRYMPPEMLTSDFNSGSFESYKQADVYSFSLVMWEVVNRCSINGCSNPYKMPYEGMVCDDPTVTDMLDLVCKAKRRPPIGPDWDRADESRARVAALVRQCWTENPEARYTSRYVKIAMNRLCSLVHDR